MGGIFGVVAEGNCAKSLFYGTDYHSHLGTENKESMRHGTVMADFFCRSVRRFVRRDQLNTFISRR
jgi:hypothetical protein